jgi:spore photoproduct lyase
MESRTKSANIDSILSINDWIPFNNTEISFSLNPEEIITTYEKWTAPLPARIKAINTLLDKNYKVWLRFLPLLPIPNYENIYKDFLTKLKKEIDIKKVHSIFIASLIYNQWDFKTMQKKNPDSSLWNFVELHENWLVKLPDEVFENFSRIFKETFPEKEIFYDFI